LATYARNYAATAGAKAVVGGNRVRETAVSFAKEKRGQPIDLSRALAFVAQLQSELAEVARCQAVTAAILGELTASSQPSCG
jgi:hypothetical protein